MQVDGKMHVDCWIQQVTTRVGAVTCWIQQSVSPKQVVGLTFVFNSEVDQFIRKFIVIGRHFDEGKGIMTCDFNSDGSRLCTGGSSG